MSHWNSKLRFILSIGLPFSLLCSSSILFSQSYSLANLEYSNPVLKKLRNEISNNLKASYSKSDRIPLTDMKYYEYKVKKTDHFFLIMTKTSMDMDTLMSVNELISPYDIMEGQILKIPNMRGIYPNQNCNIPSIKNGDCLEELSKNYSIPAGKFLFDANRKKYFLPGGKYNNREKMFISGKAFSSPLKKFVLSSKYGNRQDPFTNKQTFHGGLDLAAPEGTSVFASADGVVEFVGKRGGYGNLIIIKHDHGYETRYGHLKGFAKIKNMFLKKGDRLNKGDLIGQVGMTGRATGFHLHFEVRRFSKTERPIIR